MSSPLSQSSAPEPFAACKQIVPTAEFAGGCSDSEDLPSVALADGATDIDRQRRRIRHRALHVVHLVRIVGPE
jgi:hypothetical protein